MRGLGFVVEINLRVHNAGWNGATQFAVWSKLARTCEFVMMSRCSVDLPPSASVVPKLMTFDVQTGSKHKLGNLFLHQVDEVAD